MREIKFRAWDKEGYMMNVSSIDFEKKVITGIRQDNNGWTDNFDAFELMQYTELKDKNGKEIYEGEIVGGSVSENPTATETPNASFIVIIFLI